MNTEGAENNGNVGGINKEIVKSEKCKAREKKENAKLKKREVKQGKRRVKLEKHAVRNKEKITRLEKRAAKKEEKIVKSEKRADKTNLKIIKLKNAVAAHAETAEHSKKVLKNEKKIVKLEICIAKINSRLAKLKIQVNKINEKIEYIKSGRKPKRFFNTRNMAFMGLLIAIIVIMTFTPLGYLKAGPVEITFLPVPVAVGSIVLGPWAGALLGFVFGITSFIQCFIGSPLGTVLLAVQPVYCAIVCIIPRIIVGIIPALVFKLFKKVEKSHRKIFSYAAASFSCAFVNTALFVGGLMLFFGNTAELHSFFNSSSFWSIVWIIIGYNFLIEAAACCLLGGSIAKAVDAFVYKRKEEAEAKPKIAADTVTDSNVNNTDGVNGGESGSL